LEHSEEGVVLGNKRAWKVHGCLVKLPEQLVGGERKRGVELTAEAKARWSSGWRAEGRKGGVLIGAQALGDDG
jgi:hypothetical protein